MGSELTQRKEGKEEIVLHLAIPRPTRGGDRLEGHHLAPAVAADLSPADAAVAEGLGVCGVEVAAPAPGAADAEFVLGRACPVHRCFLRCIAAKLTRSRFAGAVPSVPGKMTPWIDAATAQPTRQSSQWLSPRSGRCFGWLGGGLDQDTVKTEFRRLARKYDEQA